MPDQPPPHNYIPEGPLDEPPSMGFRPDEVRAEAFAAVLDGVPLGAEDRRFVEWLVQWDDTTCRTVASLMWRCRLAGRAEAAQSPEGAGTRSAMTVQDDATCETVIADPETDDLGVPCGTPSRFIVERSDGDPYYPPSESCEAHLAETVSGMVDGDANVQAIITIRWDAPDQEDGDDA